MAQQKKDNRAVKKITRVVVADDHFIIRSGFCSLISDCLNNFQVVGEACNGYDAYKACQQLQPDILVTDWHMPGVMDGYQLIERVKLEMPTIKILVLTVDRRAVNGIIYDYGAHMCLVKDTNNQDLLENLSMLAARSFYSFYPDFCPPLYNTRPLRENNLLSTHKRFDTDTRMVNRSDNCSIAEEDYSNWEAEVEAQFAASKKYQRLTEREMEILLEGAIGLTHTEIAAKLVISRKTLDVHLSSIARKFGVRGFPQIISFAFRNNIIDPNILVNKTKMTTTVVA